MVRREGERKRTSVDAVIENTGGTDLHPLALSEPQRDMSLQLRRELRQR
jgi:hypothetical protein